MYTTGNNLGRLLVQGSGRDVSLAKSWIIGLAAGIVLVTIFFLVMTIEIRSQPGILTGRTTTIGEILGPLRFVIAALLVAGTLPISKAIVIPKTVIRVYERGVSGTWASKLADSLIKTSDFMLSHDQITIDLKGQELTILVSGVKYYVYAINGAQIQQAIFYQKNIRYNEGGHGSPSRGV